jgi:hypothetical protein
VVAVVVVASDPVDRVQREYDSFVHLGSQSSNETRFTSGAGNRYDYWRIAMAQFTGDPLRGVGAGNYDRTYFLERHTTEDVRQAHSIELQMLGELGLPGLFFLVLFIAAVLMGFARRARAARRSLEDRGLVVAAGGAFLVWLLHTSVDWLHLIPGLTGLAFAFAAVLVGPWLRPVGDRATTLRRIVIVGAAAVIAVGAVLVGRAAMGERYRSEARDLVAQSPAQALAKADDAIALDDGTLSSYYVKASAFARLDDYGGARGALLEAAHREPHDFVTWGLLGDLAVRRGAMRQARAAYREATRLNPRDQSLAQLAQDPSSALER